MYLCLAFLGHLKFVSSYAYILKINVKNCQQHDITLLDTFRCLTFDPSPYNIAYLQHVGHNAYISCTGRFLIIALGSFIFRLH